MKETIINLILQKLIRIQRSQDQISMTSKSQKLVRQDNQRQQEVQFLAVNQNSKTINKNNQYYANSKFSTKNIRNNSQPQLYLFSKRNTYEHAMSTLRNQLQSHGINFIQVEDPNIIEQLFKQKQQKYMVIVDNTKLQTPFNSRNQKIFIYSYPKKPNSKIYQCLPNVGTVIKTYRKKIEQSNTTNKIRLRSLEQSPMKNIKNQNQNYTHVMVQQFEQKDQRYESYNEFAMILSETPSIKLFSKYTELDDVKNLKEKNKILILTVVEEFPMLVKDISGSKNHKNINIAVLGVKPMKSLLNSNVVIATNDVFQMITHLQSKTGIDLTYTKHKIKAIGSSQLIQQKRKKQNTLQLKRNSQAQHTIHPNQEKKKQTTFTQLNSPKSISKNKIIDHNLQQQSIEQPISITKQQVPFILPNQNQNTNNIIPQTISKGKLQQQQQQAKSILVKNTNNIIQQRKSKIKQQAPFIIDNKNTDNIIPQIIPLKSMPIVSPNIQQQEDDFINYRSQKFIEKDSKLRQDGTISGSQIERRRKQKQSWKGIGIVAESKIKDNKQIIKDNNQAAKLSQNISLNNNKNNEKLQDYQIKVYDTLTKPLLISNPKSKKRINIWKVDKDLQTKIFKTEKQNNHSQKQQIQQIKRQLKGQQLQNKSIKNLDNQQEISINRSQQLKQQQFEKIDNKLKHSQKSFKKMNQQKNQPIIIQSEIQNQLINNSYDQNNKSYQPKRSNTKNYTPSYIIHEVSDQQQKSNTNKQSYLNQDSRGLPKINLSQRTEIKQKNQKGHSSIRKSDSPIQYNLQERRQSQILYTFNGQKKQQNQIVRKSIIIREENILPSNLSQEKKSILKQSSNLIKYEQQDKEKNCYQNYNQNSLRRMQKKSTLQPQIVIDQHIDQHTINKSSQNQLSGISSFQRIKSPSNHIEQSKKITQITSNTPRDKNIDYKQEIKSVQSRSKQSLIINQPSIKLQEYQKTYDSNGKVIYKQKIGNSFLNEKSQQLKRQSAIIPKIMTENSSKNIKYSYQNNQIHKEQQQQSPKIYNYEEKYQQTRQIVKKDHRQSQHFKTNKIIKFTPTKKNQPKKQNYQIQRPSQKLQPRSTTSLHSGCQKQQNIHSHSSISTSQYNIHYLLSNEISQLLNELNVIIKPNDKMEFFLSQDDLKDKIYEHSNIQKIYNLGFVIISRHTYPNFKISSVDLTNKYYTVLIDPYLKTSKFNLSERQIRVSQLKQLKNMINILMKDKDQQSRLKASYRLNPSQIRSNHVYNQQSKASSRYLDPQNNQKLYENRSYKSINNQNSNLSQQHSSSRTKLKISNYILYKSHNKQLQRIAQLFPTILYHRQVFYSRLDLVNLLSLRGGDGNSLIILIQQEDIQDICDSIQRHENYTSTNVNTICLSSRNQPNYDLLQNFPKMIWVFSSNFNSYQQILDIIQRNKIQSNESKIQRFQQYHPDIIFFHQKHQSYKGMVQHAYPNAYIIEKYKNIEELEIKSKKMYYMHAKNGGCKVILVLHPSLQNDVIDLKLFNEVYMLGRVTNLQSGIQILNGATDLMQAFRVQIQQVEY